MGHLEVPLTNSCSNSSNSLIRMTEDEEKEYNNAEAIYIPSYMEVKRKRSRGKGVFGYLCSRLNLVLDSTIWKIINFLIIALLVSSLFYMFIQNSYLKSLNSIQPDLAICSCSGTDSSSSSQTEWDEKGHQIVLDMQTLVQDPTWKFFKKSSDGISLFVHPEGNKWKATGIVPGQPERFVKYFTEDYNNWHTWDSHAKNTTILKHLSKNTMLIYNIETAYLGIQREALCMLHYEILPTGKSHYGFGFKSVIWPEETEKDEDIVRVVFGPSGGIARPSLDGQSTEFELGFDVDLRLDWLPFGKDTFLANHFAKKASALLKKIKKDDEEKNNQIAQ